MIDDLSPEQRALALAMSNISESAYCAGWMKGLEFALWHFLKTGKRKYGMSQVSDDEIDQLRVLSEKCGGWVCFDDANDETFVPMAKWEEMFRDGIAKHLPFIERESDH